MKTVKGIILASICASIHSAQAENLCTVEEFFVDVNEFITEKHFRVYKGEKVVFTTKYRNLLNEFLKSSECQGESI